MSQDVDEKPLTVRHIREVLIPAMEEVFATKKDLKELEANFRLDMEAIRAEMEKKFATKQELISFKDKSLTNQDKIIKDLEILITEKTVSYYQKQKERKLWAIMIDAMKEHRILSSEQMKEIQELEVF